MAENVKTFNGLNPLLIETFLSSKKQDIDPFLVEILQNNICKHFDGMSKLMCLYATNGQQMGLLSMNTDYYNTISGILSAVGPGSNVTLAQMLVMYAGLLGKLNGEMHVMEDIYPVMISHVLEDFYGTVEASKDDEVRYIVAIFATVIAYVVFICVKPLRCLRKVDLGRRKILKIIPVNIIQENKALKFYLMQDFKAEIEQIKNSL